MRNNKRYFLTISFILLLFFVITYLTLAFYIANQAEKDTRSKTDAIVVLGARSYIEGKYNPCLEARVIHAADLYKAKYASKVLMTGGNDTEDNVNEAETMRKIAVQNGVRPNDILLEKQATSTYENFTLSRAILKKNKLNSIIIVTEPFHMPRASLIANKLGYHYHVSPAVASPCWQPNHYFTKYFLKEPFAILLYKLKNQL